MVLNSLMAQGTNGHLFSRMAMIVVLSPLSPERLRCLLQTLTHDSYPFCLLLKSTSVLPCQSILLLLYIGVLLYTPGYLNESTLFLSSLIGQRQSRVKPWRGMAPVQPLEILLFRLWLPQKCAHSLWCTIADWVWCSPRTRLCCSLEACPSESPPGWHHWKHQKSQSGEQWARWTMVWFAGDIQNVYVTTTWW